MNDFNMDSPHDKTSKQTGPSFGYGTSTFDIERPKPSVAVWVNGGSRLSIYLVVVVPSFAD